MVRDSAEFYEVLRNGVELCAIMRNGAERCGIVRDCARFPGVAHDSGGLRGIARGFTKGCMKGCAELFNGLRGILQWPVQRISRAWSMDRPMGCSMGCPMGGLMARSKDGPLKGLPSVLFHRLFNESRGSLHWVVRNCRMGCAGL